MPSWNRQQLFSHPGGGQSQSGARLSLVGPCRADSFVPVGAATAQVFGGSTDIVVRLPTSGPPDTLLDDAMPVAREALDVLAASGGPSAVLDLSPESDVVWWQDAGKSFARLTAHHGIRVTVSAKLAVVDAAGDEVPQPAPAPVRHHESFRYFRLSQSTDDLFDAFRNAYLALESVLADITPKLRGTEKDWLLQALSNAQGIANLGGLLPCAPPDFADRFYKDIYVPVRCRLFHAKALGLDPTSSADRESVLGAYRIVMGCFLSLAEKRYGLRRQGGGGLSSYGFSALSPLVDAWSIKAGSDGADGQQSLAEVPRVTVPSEPNRIWAMGVCVTPFDLALARVSFIAAFDKEELAFSGSLEGHLATAGLDQLEVVLDLWNRYESGFRTSFRA